MIVTAFACYSGNGEGNGLWSQWAQSVDFHPIEVATNMLLSWPVIDSRTGQMLAALWGEHEVVLLLYTAQHKLHLCGVQ